MPVITIQRYICPQCGHQEDIAGGVSPGQPPVPLVSPPVTPTAPATPAPPARRWTWADGATRKCADCGGEEGRVMIPAPNGATMDWACTDPACIMHPDKKFAS